MGHSSIQMTLDRYGHLLDKVEDEVVGAMVSPFTVPVAKC
jgi:integrase